MPAMLGSLEPHWYATYTAPRHEKIVIRHLQERGVESFLPLYSSTRYWNGRRAIVEMPLFPGYLFVLICACDRLNVLEAPGVIRIVGFNGQLTPLPESEVEALKATLRVPNSRPHPFLVAGKRVRIKRGPLYGLEGVVLRTARELRVVISIETIMRSFSVEIDGSDLEPSFSTLSLSARKVI
jgi:transcription antitermination factor NusG